MDDNQEPQQQPRNNNNNNNNNNDGDEGLEQRLNEMAAVVEEMRRQQSEMQSEMQRQAALHEAERKRWHEECRQMQVERERLFKHGTLAGAAAAVVEKNRPKICGLLVSSRAIAGSKPHSPNRPKALNSLSDGFRTKILEIVREKREQFTCELQRIRQAVETDHAARALDTLSLSDQNNKPNVSYSPVRSLSFPTTLRSGSPEAFGHQIEDIVKGRRMQQQLSSVLHAQNCDSTQVDAMGYPICPMPFCSVTTKLLEHIRTCTFVTRCPIPMCSLTREVMEHYKRCKSNSCQICQPAKQQSNATQEQLLRFMDTICKGLDVDETPVEAPSIPNVVIPPTQSVLVSPFDCTRNTIPPMRSSDAMCIHPMFLPNFVTPMMYNLDRTKTETEEASMEMKMESASDVHDE